MISKAVTILTFAAVCYAIPIEEASKPEGQPQPVFVASPENAPKPELIAVPVEEKPLKTELVAVPEKAPLEQPALIAVPIPADAKVPEKSEDDLKTDNTLWWNSYYRYPVYSKHHYNHYNYNYQYVPRTYTYYENVPSTYTYWRSYW